MEQKDQSFPLFDLQLTAKIKSVQWRAFTKQAHDTLAEANQIYRNLPAHHLGISKDLRAHKNALINAVNNPSSVKFRRHLNNYQRDVASIKQHVDYLKQQHKITIALNKLEVSRTKFDLLRMRKWWLQNNKTSHLSSEAIVCAIQIILPVFENFYRLAETELRGNKHKLSSTVRFEFESYMNQLQQAIRYEQWLLCEAMLGRLEVASQKKDLEYDDITYSILEEMNNHFEPKDYQPRSGLKPEFFVLFHQYLAKNGNEKQRMRIKRLIWFNNPNYKAEYIDNMLIIVPKNLMQFGVPTKTSFLSYFSYWHHFRKDFYQKNFHFLAQMALLDNNQYLSSEKLEQLIKGKTWQQLLKMEQESLTLKAKVQLKAKSWLLRIFSPQQYAFFKKWLQCIDQGQQIIDVQKLNYAWRLAEQLKTRYTFEIDQGLLHSNQTKITLKELIISIENSSERFDNAELSRWHEIKSTFECILKLSNHQQQNQIEARELASSPLKSTRVILSSLQAEVRQLTREKTSVKTDYQSIVKFLIKEEVFDLANPQLNFYLSELEVNILDPDLSIMELQQFWQMFFTTYLKTCLSKDSNDQQLLKINDFILRLAPDLIRQRVSMLETNRQAQNKFLYNTRCQALLFSFKQFNHPAWSENRIGNLSAGVI